MRRARLPAEERVALDETTRSSEFATFYAEWRDPIRRALSLAIGNVAVANDAIDEAMTRALTSWSKIREYDRPEGWVYKVGLNWARGVFRKGRYEVLTQLDPDLHGVDVPEPEVDLMEAIGRLSSHLRSIVVARYYLDWSTADVAAAYDIAEGTVKSRLSRALNRLAKDLGEGS